LTFSKLIRSFVMFFIVFLDSFDSNLSLGENAITRKSGVLYLFDNNW